MGTEINHDQGSKEKNSRRYNQQPKSRSWKIDRHRCWWEVYRLVQSHFVGKDHTCLSHLKRLGILLDLALGSHLSFGNIIHLKFSLPPQVHCVNVFATLTLSSVPTSWNFSLSFPDTISPDFPTISLVSSCSPSLFEIFCLQSSKLQCPGDGCVYI